MTESVELLGIGNAILDIHCRVDDSELQSLGLTKGMMALIDEQKLRQFDETTSADSISSGGSVANSVTHFSVLGGRGQLIGKVADDSSGKRFRHELTELNIEFRTSPLVSDVATGRCFIFVTPDAERTMFTYLGASARLSLDDLDAQALSQASIFLIEGYLWDLPDTVELILQMVEIAKSSNTLIALSLSDPMLVDRHLAAMRNFVSEHVDLVFANELEAQHLCESDSLVESQKMLAEMTDHALITRGRRGSVAVVDRVRFTCPAIQVTNVMDTTGAGDAFAGGYIYGLTRNWSVDRCMKLASETAAETISHMGARQGGSS